MRTTYSKEERDRVLSMRGVHTQAEIARITGIPVGTIKAMHARAAKPVASKVDNEGPAPRNVLLDALLTPFPAVPSASPPLFVPEPLQSNEFGDPLLNRAMWARSLIQTGFEAHVAKGIEILSVLPPWKKIADRYSSHLLVKYRGNTLQAAFAMCGMDDPVKSADACRKRFAHRCETMARWGSLETLATLTEIERMAYEVSQVVEDFACRCYDADRAGCNRPGAPFIDGRRFELAESEYSDHESVVMNTTAVVLSRHPRMAPASLTQAIDLIEWVGELDNHRRAVGIESDRDAIKPTSCLHHLGFGALTCLPPWNDDEARLMAERVDEHMPDHESYTAFLKHMLGCEVPENYRSDLRLDDLMEALQKGRVGA